MTRALDKVLIADDHPIIVLALSEMFGTWLGRQPARVQTVTHADALLECLSSHAWECLILDMYMPGRLRSVPLLEAALQLQPRLRTMVYTGTVTPCLALAALEAGALAYVSKASGPEVVIQALSAVAEGNTFVDPAIDLEQARDHPWYRLTPGERAIVIALARGEHLQGIAMDSGRSYKTITTHKYNALRKLGLRSKEEIGHYLVRAGLSYLLD